MNLIYGIAATIIATILLILMGYAIRRILRFHLRPEITIKHTIEPIDNPPPLQTSKEDDLLSKYGDFSLWIQPSETIYVNHITFKRLCKYQKNCLLFRFLVKVGDLQNQPWCPIANVDTLKNESYGLAKPSDEEQEAIHQAMSNTGEFCYRLTNSILDKGYWTNIGAPVRLLKELSHIVEIRLDFWIDLTGRRKTIRLIDDLLSHLFRFKGNTRFSTVKRLRIEFTNNKKESVTNGASEVKLTDTICIGSSYTGFGKFNEQVRLISNLENCINEFLNKHSPSEVKEFSTQDMRNMLIKQFPSLNRVQFTQPPDGKYRTLDKNGWQDLLQCISIAGDFCKKFLNCSNLALLYPHFVRYFAVLPYVLKDSYSYLLAVGHSPITDLIINLRLRKGALLLTLIRFIKAELPFMLNFYRIRRELKKRNDNLAKFLIRARGSQ